MMSQSDLSDAHTVETRLEEISSIIEQVKSEVNDLKDGTLTSSSDGGQKVSCKELLQRVEKLEGTLGVEKIILTDVGERVQVIVQTPLGSVLVPLHHTSNTNKAKHTIDGGSTSTGSTTYVAPAFPSSMKGAPPAGMTPEQLQDFKKQTLQITQLQTKIKELEGKLTDANSQIKKGEDVNHELTKKELEDVKEIYLYLDNINSTMSEKIASQRVEMEKLAGDIPQPINYDPFNYGDAYSGDVVDFEARKRIVELKLLLQGLQMAMNNLKDSVKISPEIDLGYKVVRLDQLLESTGFGAGVKAGDYTSENGLLMNQASDIEPPETRYPKLEAFQTSTDNKESTWAVTDSIMQTMYRLEVELGQLQKTVDGYDGRMSSIRDGEGNERLKLAKNDGDYDTGSPPHISQSLNKKPTLVPGKDEGKASNGDLNYQFLQHNHNVMEKGLANLSDVVKRMEAKVETLNMENFKRKQKKAIDNTYTDSSSADPFSNPLNVIEPERHPVRLRHLMQRFFAYQVPYNKYEAYRLPKLDGRGYNQEWPNIKVNKPELQKKYKENMKQLLEPICDEYMIRGKDGHYYRGDKAPPRVIS